jgi:subtilase family serine protease
MAELPPCLIYGQAAGSASAVVTGNVSPQAKPELDEGSVAPSFELHGVSLLLKRSSAQEQQLKQLLKEQQDPSSHTYRKWITPDEYADRFGSTNADLLEIEHWLMSQGFQIRYVARTRTYISFDGTAAQVKKAFNTSIHRFRVNGEEHYANTSDPSVPAGFADKVLGFRGLDDFHPKPLVQLNGRVNSAAGFLTYGNGHYLAPDDIATIYDITSIYNAGYEASGQSIVVVGASDINTQDLVDFLTVFSLPGFNLTQILYPGSPDPGTNGALTEADLDLEWVSGTARGANVIYVFGVDATSAAAYAIDQDLAPVISESFGGCEQKFSATYLSALETAAQQANAEGITWLASSGDSGAADCDHDQTIATHGLSVNVPASTPEITSVGGTEFNEGTGTYWSSSNSSTGESALSYIPEIAWNDTDTLVPYLASSGGGVSAFYPKPPWQVGMGVPNDGVRDVPDISFTASAAHDGYIICTDLDCESSFPPNLIEGGTSASTPVFAGIVTLLNKYLSVQGILPSPGLGNINPTLYGLAQVPFSPPIFHDVTSGSNQVPCQAGTTDCPNGGVIGYLAGPGYDLVTGWGSVDAGFLVGTWPGPPTQFQLSGPSGSTAGAQIAISLAVLDKNGNLVVNYANTVHFTSSDSAASLPGDYTFGTRDAGSAAFNAVLRTSGTQCITITDANLGHPSAIICVNVSPGPTSHFLLSAPSTLTAGTPFNLTVTAQDAFNNTTPAYNGTVSFTSTDPKGAVPSPFPFGSADAGMHTFTALLLETAGNQTVSAQDTGNGISGAVTIAITPAAASSFLFTVPSQAQTGEPFSVAVGALDPFDNAATGYSGTVTFSSSDSAASLPANYTFTAVDAGTHDFTNALTLNTLGSQTITVRDVNNNSIQTTASIGVVADLPLAAAGRVIRFFRSTPQLVVATVIDADNNETGSHLSATIDWGDGTSNGGTIVQATTGPNTFAVLGSHTYLQRGPFAVTVTIHDAQGSVAVAHSTASFWPRSFSH